MEAVPTEEVRNESLATSGRNKSDGRGAGSQSHQGHSQPKSMHIGKIIGTVFHVSVILMVAISVILSLVQTARGQANGLPLLLGTAILSVLSVHVVLILLVRSGEVKRRNLWFVYVVGACIIVECIFTNVVIFK